MSQDAKTRAAFRFFLANAGYSTPPGRAVCALRLARAEVAFQASADLTFHWVDDPDCDISWMSDAERQASHVREGCYLTRYCPACDSTRPDYSVALWGIVDADRDYRRVIEAKLACEAGF